MLSKFKTDYDAEEDLLYLYNENKKSKGSIEFGDLIVDLEKQGTIVGLEIFEASKYLSELTNKKITKEILDKMQKTTISFVTKKGTTIIKISLPIEKGEVPATIAIQNMHYKSPMTA
ncbi:MAG: hypothetical protein COT15_03150 [Candidatus Diapherotrites archaeon CG08_land_8_20_14_0_20_34_12]|nr:MAG: hypothetical protein COT15_03150 [Candidatus Diapherotrites archaeon CG08_land_8_20_14_0_20_34_12]